MSGAHTHDPMADVTAKMANTSIGPKKQYGKHAAMPVLAADQYAEVELPQLTEFTPDDIKLDATLVAVGKRRPYEAPDAVPPHVRGTCGRCWCRSSSRASSSG